MKHRSAHRGCAAISTLTIAGASIVALQAIAENLDYHPIDPIEAGRTVTLTGHDLTIDEVIEVARGGAKVQLSAEAKQREGDNYGLLLEAPAAFSSRKLFAYSPVWMSFRTARIAFLVSSVTIFGPVT